MSILDVKCSGMTCKNVLPAEGGKHFSMKRHEKAHVFRKMAHDRLHVDSISPLIGPMLAPRHHWSAPGRFEMRSQTINVRIHVRECDPRRAHSAIKGRHDGTKERTESKKVAVRGLLLPA